MPPNPAELPGNLPSVQDIVDQIREMAEGSGWKNPGPIHPRRLDELNGTTDTPFPDGPVFDR